MSNDFTFVKRPKLERQWPTAGKWARVTRALESTVHNGRAVRIPLNGDSSERVRNSLRKNMNVRGLTFRSVVDGDCIIAWTVEMGDEYLQREMG